MYFVPNRPRTLPRESGLGLARGRPAGRARPIRPGQERTDP